jgi:hypothetical protein
VALGAVGVENLLGVCLRCRKVRESKKKQREQCNGANSVLFGESFKHFSLAKY